jgi:hypothetical protein
MTDFLFIPSQSANGGRFRVRLNDLPRLFAEGIEEPVPRQPNSWERLQKIGTAAIGSIHLKLESQRAAFASKRTMFEARNIKSICAARQRREPQAQA